MIRVRTFASLALGSVFRIAVILTLLCLGFACSGSGDDSNGGSCSLGENDCPPCYLAEDNQCVWGETGSLCGGAPDAICGGKTLICSLGQKSVLRCSADGKTLSCEKLCPEGTGCQDGQCQACVPHESKTCHEDDSYWVDSCGVREELHQECGDNEKCSGGECGGGSCALDNCSVSGFSYTCGTGDKQVSNNYGGPGPDGISSYVVSYSNGHKVTCTFTSSSSGKCSDDTGATCSF